MNGSEAGVRPRIALTMGDPNGIGPEVVLKALADDDLRETVDPVIVGAAPILERVRADLGIPGALFGNPAGNSASAAIDVIDVSDGDPDPTPDYGLVDGRAGRLAMRAVEAAVDLCLSGDVDAMVTAPISKESVRLGGYDIPGHTEFIADRVAAATGADRLPHTMMMVSEALRVGLVTGHMPLRDVAEAVTDRLIIEKLRVIDASLRLDFGIDRPRIGVLGLNPHAGDGGVLGMEEIDIVSPALETARSEGMDVSGPFAADGFFGRRADRTVDAVLAMYHDQGLVPFKALSFERGTNFTAGLPIIRTSPDHGTAFDIAGKGRASARSLKTAIRVAAQIVEARAGAGESE